LAHSSLSLFFSKISEAKPYFLFIYLFHLGIGTRTERTLLLLLLLLFYSIFYPCYNKQHMDTSHPSSTDKYSTNNSSEYRAHYYSGKGNVINNKVYQENEAYWLCLPFFIYLNRINSSEWPYSLRPRNRHCFAAAWSFETTAGNHPQ
jgi:hypothetical protein